LRFAVEGVVPFADFLKLPVSVAELDALDIPKTLKTQQTVVALLQRRYLAAWGSVSTDVPTRFCYISENETGNYKTLKIDGHDLRRFKARARSEGMIFSDDIDETKDVDLIGFKSDKENIYHGTRMSIVYGTYSDQPPFDAALFMAASPVALGTGS
jgi:hypothetical protein